MIKKETVALKRFAYDAIKKMIINCVYAPGYLFNEHELVSQLNISRTPIREALNRLEQEGLVRIIPKKGILVSNISIADFSQIYQARIELEPYVVQISGPHLEREKLFYFRDHFLMETGDDDHMAQFATDTAFHTYLAENCNNKYIYELMKKVLDENTRVMISTRNNSRMDNACNEHVKIIDLLLLGDYEAASQVMRTHLVNSRDFAVVYFLDRKKK